MSDHPNALIAWLLSGDCGMSSKAIAARYAGVPPESGYYSHPYDGDDFGRCYRLVKLVPELSIEVMRGASSTWDRLVDAWPELVTAYEAELVTRDYKPFYQLITALRNA